MYEFRAGLPKARFYILPTLVLVLLIIDAAQRRSSNLTTTDLPLADAVEGVIDDRNEYVYFTRFGLQVTGDNAKVYRGGAKVNYGALNSAAKPKHSCSAANTTAQCANLCYGRTDSILLATAMATTTSGRVRSMVQMQNS